MNGLHGWWGGFLVGATVVLALLFAAYLEEQRWRRRSHNATSYTGPHVAVKCAYPPCRALLRAAAHGGPQWCSKAHRAATAGHNTAVGTQHPNDHQRSHRGRGT